LLQRKRDNEGCAFSGLTFGRNVAVVPINDPPAHGQPNACPFVLGSAMQPLEDSENLVHVLFVETNPVVLDSNLALGLL
jgi:hypothetical protein